jgi:hypothetical protein
VTDKGNLAPELHQRRHDIATILSEKKVVPEERCWARSLSLDWMGTSCLVDAAD